MRESGGLDVPVRLLLAADEDPGAVTYAAKLLLRQMGLSLDPEIQRDGVVEGALVLPGGIRVASRELRNIFDAVSLKREMETGQVDQEGRFADSAIAWDSEDPWVLRRAGNLRGMLEDRGILAPSPSKALRVIITHDVDWVTPTGPVSMLKSIIGRNLDGRRTWLGLADTLKPLHFLRNLERLLDLEVRIGVHPWFFLLGARGGLGRHSNRYNPRSVFARRYISLIREAGGEVGLHGSYHARERDSYGGEAAMLSDVWGGPVVAHRNHYLRFDSRTVWSQLERAGIKLDFSLGFSSRLGFRVPLTGPFNPFDWTSGQPSAVRAIPTIAMDRIWWPDRRTEVLKELRDLLRAVGGEGGTVAVLIHPEVLVLDSRWFALFEAIISVCLEAGASVDTTLDELLVSGAAGGGL
jgi:hypothetical protein